MCLVVSLQIGLAVSGNLVSFPETSKLVSYDQLNSYWTLRLLVLPDHVSYLKCNLRQYR